MGYDMVSLEILVEQYGLCGLFLASFISSTILPLSTEALLLLAIGLKMQIIESIGTVVLASTLGGLTTYGLGRVGNIVLRKKIRVTKLEIYKKIVTRSGAPVIFMAAFTPLPYEFFALAAGILRMNPLVFVASTASGRALRFTIIGVFTKKGFELVRIGKWSMATILFSVGLVVVFLLVYISWQFLKKLKKT
jgi:membrane protein YqaA with SNARE-associated domain